MAFADTFKLKRIQAKMSQAQLSQAMGISKRAIINYESGKNLPNSEKLKIIAKFFNMPIASLMTEEEEFIAEAYEKGGRKGARDAESLVNEVNGLFAGGRLSDDELDAVMKAIQGAYWIAKEENKRKYAAKQGQDE